MLSRREIRIKVMQALYAFGLSQNDRLDQGEKQLIDSIDRIHRLYIWQLAFISEVFQFAEKRLDENKHKLVPTEDDLNPNTRFIENKTALQITNNLEFSKFYKQYKINFSDQIQIVRKFYNLIKDSEEYQKYMALPSCNYTDDKEMIYVIIRKYLVDFELLQYFYEDQDIHWVDDYDSVLVLLNRTIKGFKESHDESYKLPSLLKINIDGKQEDKLFARQLFIKCIAKNDSLNKIIEENVTNWEFDRIAKIDIVLLRMAICEFLEFSTIPVKVTINEYIDISKIFSSPKSKVFINGMLDKLAQIFKEDGSINKSGRGLIEN